MPHKKWVEECANERKRKIKLLSDCLDRSPAMIWNYISGRNTPSKEIREDISLVTECDILWNIGSNEYVITPYNPTIEPIFDNTLKTFAGK